MNKTIKVVAVIYELTGEEVPFIYNKSGEIIITSTNPKHTDENCFVTYIEVLIK